MNSILKRMPILCFICLLQLTGCVKSVVREQAAEIIEKSYQAHGGIHATDSLKIAFKVTIFDRINETQSLVPFSPFETYETVNQVWIDKPKRQQLFKLHSSSAGFVNDNIMYVSDSSGFNIDVTFKNYSPVTSLPNPAQLFHHLVLKAGSADTSKVKLADDKELNDKATYHLVVDTIHVFVSKDDYLVQRLERPIYDPVFGRGTQITTYSNYQKAGKVVVPQRWVNTRITPVYDTVTNKYDLSEITAEFDVPVELFKIPEGCLPRESNSREREVQELANGVFFMENINAPGGPYHALIAEFSDFVLVTEAPLDPGVSKSVIQKVTELFPGKPLKFLVQSHHHGDHIGGIMGYANEGVTIVTTRDASLLINKMSEVLPATPGAVQAAPRIELVDRKWNVSDKQNECIVFDIGPSVHSREILVTWFPRQKILFHADLENEELAKTINELKLDVDFLVPAHDKILKKKEIKSLLRL